MVRREGPSNARAERSDQGRPRESNDQRSVATAKFEAETSYRGARSHDSEDCMWYWYADTHLSGRDSNVRPSVSLHDWQG